MRVLALESSVSLNCIQFQMPSTHLSISKSAGDCKLVAVLHGVESLRVCSILATLQTLWHTSCLGQNSREPTRTCGNSSACESGTFCWDALESALVTEAAEFLPGTRMRSRRLHGVTLQVGRVCSSAARGWKLPAGIILGLNSKQFPPPPLLPTWNNYLLLWVTSLSVVYFLHCFGRRYLIMYGLVEVHELFRNGCAVLPEELSLTTTVFPYLYCRNLELWTCCAYHNSCWGGGGFVIFVKMVHGRCLRSGSN